MKDISKIDFSKGYGVITGDSNVRYTQDGHLYRHDGTLFSNSPAPQEISVEPVKASKEERNKQRSEAMRRIWARRKAGESNE